MTMASGAQPPQLKLVWTVGLQEESCGVAPCLLPSSGFFLPPVMLLPPPPQVLLLRPGGRHRCPHHGGDGGAHRHADCGRHDQDGGYRAGLPVCGAVGQLPDGLLPLMIEGVLLPAEEFQSSMSSLLVKMMRGKACRVQTHPHNPQAALSSHSAVRRAIFLTQSKHSAEGNVSCMSVRVEGFGLPLPHAIRQ